ncbi:MULTISPECIES: NAD(P)-dependent oxidoreductase [Pandoraea]|jgi:3-hydroxyisobutyrate dehydrogenase-like beta-hydroxyacid dehydrogenase|uniref:NAD(P)-dependent oxidoreductase n=1 Tax=Pandoraea TaxID=93217 RepID=UPI0003C7722E|nr:MULTISPECIES: NAD(P)-dependent oxidoreductase [Pandoraea]AHB07015.1 6-phosphogluconate dehydrogenase [Pandoraea pnomenusa 3kgm]AHB76865.1 2-hydroxy-3-oxopropionate reductase [Pandoraea pnomenusa]AHN74827.1 2-hydroxy-3-oxopropionate reductase [Pandoraea pnomenusa]ANC45668.1 2-hydroxy-3-oxopropionate reductase [Pandoraea pnomenusa]QDH58820.1 NAD(P)-dependent oxidoreductase [Pandoraea pnomenusa]
MTTYTVAFIGLGAMGGQMVRHLIAAGHRLHVYARRPEAAAPYEALGAKRFETPAQAAADADFVITNVTTTQDVEDVLLGRDGVVHGARAGTICVDHSTISAEATRRMAARLARHEIQLVDAPVSGGPSRAADASLSIMVGAPDVVFARVRPLLSVLGSTITHVGDVGAGQVAKACNQIVQVINIQGIAEAMLFAARNGVDQDKVIEAISQGLAGSRMLDMMGPKMAHRDFSAGIEARLHDKDFSMILEAVADAGLSLPALSLVKRQLSALMENGWGRDDTSSLLRVLEGQQQVH